jgi:hypothetical protein
MFYKIKKYIIVPGRAGTAGRDSGPSTARFSYRARPGTIKRAVLRAGPLDTAHLAIYMSRGRRDGRRRHVRARRRQQSSPHVGRRHAVWQAGSDDRAAGN